jgi:chromate transporter
VNDDSPLAALSINFLILSLFTIGGINASVPEMHRLVVDVHGWMSDERFADLFAIAQAAPGPNLIIVTLIGWEVAGVAGALAATLAIIGPTSVAAYFVGQVWHRFRHARWRIAIQAGVTPITIGLVASTAFVIGRGVDTSIVAAGITVGSAIALYLTQLHPLIFLAVGAALGAAGLI